MAAQSRATRPPWLGRWVLLATTGEALGFLLPAAVGAAATESEFFALLLAGAGAIEGALLGVFQLIVLRRLIPRLNSPAWVGATSAAAVAAYLLGLAPSTFADAWMTWPWPAQAAALVVLTTALLGSIGTAQWLVLRRHLRNAWQWIIGSAAAWLIGLSIFFAVATPLWHEGQSLPLTFVIGAVAGVLMAIAMALSTGVTLALLLRRQDR